MGIELTSRMKPEPDEFYYFAVGDCTTCGVKDVPFNTVVMTDRFTPITYCLNCHEGSVVKPKGYVSLIDLEDTEWNYEL